MLLLIVSLFVGCNSTPKIEIIATEQPCVENNSEPTEVRGTNEYRLSEDEVSP